VGCHIWYSEEGTGWGCSPPRPLLDVPNVTAHPSAASVPITILLYDGPLLCSFHVAIKGLINLSVDGYFGLINLSVDGYFVVFEHI